MCDCNSFFFFPCDLWFPNAAIIQNIIKSHFLWEIMKPSAHRHVNRSYIINANLNIHPKGKRQETQKKNPSVRTSRTWISGETFPNRKQSSRRKKTSHICYRKCQYQFSDWYSQLGWGRTMQCRLISHQCGMSSIRALGVSSSQNLRWHDRL